MSSRPAHDWQTLLRQEIAQTVTRRRWGHALVAIGWIHLIAFAFCQALVDPAIKSDPRHAMLWACDVLGSLLAIRLISGAGWFKDTTSAGLVVRVWGTYLILAFSLATLNGVSGWDHDWFKPPWATLSSFGFAIMAWLFDLRLLLLAVPMFVTGLLMIAWPKWNYLTFGLSWWLELQVLGLVLWRQAARGHLVYGISRSRSSNETSVATPATPK
jgi:hypothetical protein